MSITRKEIIIWRGYWSISDVRNNPDKIFIYGDNLIGKGLGGQAIIRNEPNAFGIPTKKFPSMANKSFLRDDEIVANRKAIRDSIYRIIDNDREILVFPEDGLGTGLSQLSTKAPKTWDYLLYALNKYLGQKQ